MKGITMSGALPLQVLSGAKTQTRRTIKPQPQPNGGAGFHPVKPYHTPQGRWSWVLEATGHGCGDTFACPYGAPGDRLYVRETHYRFGHWEPLAGQVTKKGRKQKWGFVADDPTVIFDAPPVFRKGRHHKDPATPAWHKRLARFMAKASARTILEVVEIRVQRLHEISEADAMAEGCPIDEPCPRCGDAGWVNNGAHGVECTEPGCGDGAVDWFRKLWKSINGEDSWAANPWVWVITFKIIRG